MGILVIVSLTILIVSSVSRRAIPGQPIAQPVAAAPQIGDCLLDPAAREGELNSWSEYLASVSTAPCTGTRFGEIVDVLPQFSALTTDPAGALDGEAMFDATSRCFDKARRHVGISEEVLDSAGPWWPAIQIGSALVGPDERQRADGQDWAACLAYPPTGTAGSPGQTDGSLNGGWQQGRGQQLFAVCFDALGEGLPTGCQEPHRYEIFGTLGETVTTPAQPDLQVSCAEVIAAATAMPDITAGGALSVQVVRFAYDDDGTMVVGDRGPVSDAGQQGIGSAFCLITPTRDVQHLTASLRELGAGPVPLS